MWYRVSNFWCRKSSIYEHVQENTSWCVANSTTEEIKLAGTKIFQWIYSTTRKNDFPKALYELRYGADNAVAAKGKIDPERLPEDAVQQHSLRAYLQLQDWMVLKCSSREASTLVSCSCNNKKGCNTNRCSCVKNGVNCASFCVGCHGDCCNTKEESLDLEEDDNAQTISIICYIVNSDMNIN